MSLDEALLEYMKRIDAGEPVDEDAFVAAHPAHAADLRAYFGWSQEVDVMLGPEGAGDLLLCDTAETLELEARALAQTPPASGGGAAADGGAPPVPGEAFHGYLIEEELHRGRSLLYRAREGGRTVVLKLLPDPRPAASLRGRLQRLAGLWSELADPSVLPLLGAGVAGAGVYLVTPLCPGGDLAAWRARAQRGPAEKAAIVLSLALALAEAHGRGLIHGALHPGNVLFSGEGDGESDRPLLTDFDLGLRDDGGGRSSVAGAATRAVVAAPGYLAPERARGGALRPAPALDVYGLGALLYFLLAGRAPYVGVTPMETRLLVVHESPAPPRAHAPGADPELEALCLRCLARDPAARPESIAAVAEALAALGAQPAPAPDAQPGTLGRALRWLRRL